MTLSTIQLGDDLQRESLYTLLRRKISIFHTMLGEPDLSKDDTESVKLMIQGAERYANFLSRKGAIITFTIDDADNIDKIIDFKL